MVTVVPSPGSAGTASLVSMLMLPTTTACLAWLVGGTPSELALFRRSPSKWSLTTAFPVILPINRSHARRPKSEFLMVYVDIASPGSSIQEVPESLRSETMETSSGVW